MSTVLAFDLGASNGRVAAVRFDGEKMELETMHRFKNGPVGDKGHYYWDYEYLLNEMIKGIQKAQAKLANRISSMGFDTWGVDFGMIDRKGQLVSKPFSYRDTHTIPFMNEVLNKIDGYELFKMTGNEISSINTIFQLYAIQKQYPRLMDLAERIVMMPNLIQYSLTGESCNEFTIASTSQMVDYQNGSWNTALLKKMFKRELPLAAIQMPHREIGPLSPFIQKRYQIKNYPVMNTPGHDTACALSALPISNHEEAYFISIGTWALVGKETEKPVATYAAYKEHFTNEGTSEGKYRFQKNGMGFWIMQQLRKEWEMAGQAVNFEKENEFIKAALKNDKYIDPDDKLFFNPASMQEAIKKYCIDTGQTPPSTQEELTVCIYESLALKFAHTIARIEELTGKKAKVIHIGGGGIQNKFLCQFIANASEKHVIAGPVEASAIGNALSQMRALGEISTLKEGREIVLKSFGTEEYTPQKNDYWKKAKKQFAVLLQKGRREHDIE